MTGDARAGAIVEYVVELVGFPGTKYDDQVIQPFRPWIICGRTMSWRPTSRRSVDSAGSSIGATAARRPSPGVRVRSPPGESERPPAGARARLGPMAWFVPGSSVRTPAQHQSPSGDRVNAGFVSPVAGTSAAITLAMFYSEGWQLGDRGGVNRHVQTGRTVCPAHARCLAARQSLTTRAQDIGSDGERPRSFLGCPRRPLLSRLATGQSLPDQIVCSWVKCVPAELA